MTNREWLLNKMQNMSDEELAETLKVREKLCNIINPSDDCNSTCSTCKLSWLQSEHKEPITLSEVERVILENVRKDYKWIARNENGNLKISSEKLQKSVDFWYTEITYYTWFEAFNHLFQFITWEDNEPYNIEELLKGEQV